MPMILSANPYESIGVDVTLIDEPRGVRDADRLAVANPSVGYNAPLTTRGIRGMFYEALELGAQSVWAMACGLFFLSDTETESHKWLGQVPEPRKHIGGLNLNQLRNLGVSITNEEYETSIRFKKRDWRNDKTGHMRRRLPQLATAYLDHWNSLVVTLIEANGSAFDGVAFFSDSHSLGSSGTLDNNISYNASSTSALTKTEAIDVLTQGAAQFFTFKDDQGRPANQGARDFLVVGPPGHAPGCIAAINDSLNANGGTNELSNLGWRFRYVPEARLGSAAVLYMFRVDDKSSPAFILQEEDTPSVEFLGEGSEHWIKNNEAIGTAKATRAAGLGDYKKAVKITIT